MPSTRSQRSGRGSMLPGPPPLPGISLTALPRQGQRRCGPGSMRKRRSPDVDDPATLWWDNGKDCLCYIEQTLLPGEYLVIECRSVDRLATAIRRLEVRGAPALGVAGAYGVALAARTSPHRDFGGFMAGIRQDAEQLRSTRPTAINLGWGIDR